MTSHALNKEAITTVHFTREETKFVGRSSEKWICCCKWNGGTPYEDRDLIKEKLKEQLDGDKKGPININ